MLSGCLGDDDLVLRSGISNPVIVGKKGMKKKENIRNKLKNKLKDKTRNKMGNKMREEKYEKKEVENRERVAWKMAY